MRKLRRCTACGAYTLTDSCPACGRPTASPHPARFSPEDPYGRYRRQRKREVMAEHGDDAERVRAPEA